MPYTNYHGHCHYCDGKEAPEAYVRAAVEQQMPSYGFSSHAPLPYGLPWPMAPGQLLGYQQEVAALKAQYADQVTIYCGLEVDYIPGVIGPKGMRTQAALDYTIGSVHFVDFFDNGQPWEIDGSYQVFQRGLHDIFNDDIRLAIERYYALIKEMVEKEPPDMVGHLDKIKIQSRAGAYFGEQNGWYRQAVLKTLDAIAQRALMVEVNTRGVYKKKSELYPSPWILARMREREIPIVLNSDAHHPREIATFFPEAVAQLTELGYTTVQQLQGDEWQAVPIATLLTSDA